MDKSFGLKLQVLKHLARLPLGYLQTKNKLTIQSHCATGHRFVLKTRTKIYDVETSRNLLVSLIIIRIVLRVIKKRR